MPVDTEATTDTAEPSATSEPAADAGPDLGEFQPISGVPGVTDEAIQYAVLGTGPSNPAGYCLLECYLGGVQAYFDYRNSLGGVHGRQLEITHEVDDELANTQVKLLELIGSDDVFGTFFAPLIPSGHEDANAARMPIYTLVQGGPEGAGFDNVYIPAIFCADCLRKSTVHQAELVGATKVASLGLGVSQASKDCVAATEKAFEQWGPDVGIEFVYANDTLPFGLTERSRSGSDGDEGSGRRLHHAVYRSERRADAGAGVDTVRAWPTFLCCCHRDTAIPSSSRPTRHCSRVTC